MFYCFVYMSAKVTTLARVSKSLSCNVANYCDICGETKLFVVK